MNQVSAELAHAMVAASPDHALTLGLDTIYAPDGSPWMVPAYRFDILVRGRKAGTISLRVGDDERLLRYAGHVGYAVDEPWRGQHLAERAT